MERQLAALDTVSLKLTDIPSFVPDWMQQQYGTKPASEQTPTIGDEGVEILYDCHSGNCCPEVTLAAGMVAMRETAQPEAQVTMSPATWGNLATRFVEIGY